MAKSEMTALFILVSQRRPSGSFALMILQQGRRTLDAFTLISPTMTHYYRRLI